MINKKVMELIRGYRKEKDDQIKAFIIKKVIEEGYFNIEEWSLSEDKLEKKGNHYYFTTRLTRNPKGED